MTSLDQNRRATAAFIAVAPVVIELVPHTRTKTSTGGYTLSEGTPRDPQVMTIIEPPTNPRPTVAVDGVVREIEFMLLGLHDAIISDDDTFTHGGREWHVVSVFYDNGWERRASVVRRGR